MAPKVQPKVPNAKVRIEDVITKDGKFDSDKFWKLTDAQIADLVGDAIHDVRTYIVQPTTSKKAASSIRLLEALDKENPDLGLSHYVTLFKSMESGNGSALTKNYLDSLKRYDPDTFNLYLKHPGWEAYDRPDFDLTMYRAENMPKDIEPTAGILSNNPINSASPAEAAPGALTNPPTKSPEGIEQAVPSRVRVRDDEGNITEFEVGPKKLSYQSWDDAELNEILARGSKKGETNEKLPEASNQPALPNVGRTIEEAEAEAYPPIDEGKINGNYYSPTSPGVHIRIIDAEGKPVDLTPKEIAKFKPNSASPSPSPEAVGEAMRDATTTTTTTTRDTVDLVGDTTLKPEDKPAFLTKEGGSLPKKESTKVENATDKTIPETQEGALTGKDKKPTEPSKGMFKKMLGWVRNHPKTSWGVGIPTVLGLVGGIGFSQANKIAEALKAGEDLDRNADEEPELPEVFDNVNYRVWENYTPDYLNEEYTPGKIPSHIPQDKLPPIKESTASKKVKSQPQVVNASENNATADYVRAAYNSYIPSDAGRAYQKAIYGDPLELDRMRLQQQQQKWRDFVMRSGQSPAELVQRGLMPYDALQYV